MCVRVCAPTTSRSVFGPVHELYPLCQSFSDTTNSKEVHRDRAMGEGIHLEVKKRIQVARGEPSKSGEEKVASRHPRQRL